MEYEVYDLQLWNSVLQKLVSFNMVSHMYITILLKLFQSLVSHFVYLGTNTASWNSGDDIFDIGKTHENCACEL